MSHAHSHGPACDHEHTKREADDLPTATLTTQREYARALTSPMTAIISEIREGVVDRDVLGLQSTQRFEPDDLPQFDFPSDDAKRDAFMDWLDAQQERGVLSVISPDENEFIDDAYISGMGQADTLLEDAGADTPSLSVSAAFDQPIHQDRVATLYTRNYELLEGITEDMADEIRGELSQGMVDGINPRDMARNLNDRVDKVGRTRATTLARTEVMHSHNDAALTRYDESPADIERVDVLTSDPCDLCASYAASGPYPIQEARGGLPLHPNCVCAYRPVVK